MPKVLLLFCGGTIIMRQGEDGALRVKDIQVAMDSLLALEPRLHELAQIDLEYIDNIDSTNMNPKHWDHLTDGIARKYEEYDGFVITQGTDTMAYTASALTFSLGKLGKPVILTGAQIPGDQVGSDARFNLVNAVRVAVANLAGVYIVFDEQIILGARASKVSESKLSAFATKNAPDAGEIRTEIRLQKNLPKRSDIALQAQSGFEDNILIITLIPGRDVETLMQMLEIGKIKGLIIRAYATGNIPYTFLPLLEQAKEQRIPVVVTSQCLHGSTAMERYDVGAQALKLNVVQLYDMSLECAATKFMWALRHYGYGEMREVMQRNFVGEMNVDGELYE